MFPVLPTSDMSTHRQKTPKIVHLTSVHAPFDVRIFHKECKSIGRAGYDVTLLAAHDRDETVDGIHLRPIFRPAIRLARILCAPWSIYRESLRQEADLFHFHDPELIPVGLLLRLAGKRVVYDAHEDVSADIAFKHYIPRLLRYPLARVVGAFERASVRHFSAVVAATPAISRRFLSRHPRCIVVRNYPSPDGVQLAAKPWETRSSSAVYTGLLSPDRSIRQLVDAVALLPENIQATLHLAGPFSPPTYQRTVAESEGWKRVNFLGTIPPSSVAHLLNDARVGLCVYRPDPNSLEAVPNKIFEYMQAALPVIASDFPGFREIVKGTSCGLLVNPCDRQEIAHAIAYILSHPQEAEQMGLRGREAVRACFSWTTEERKLLQLYDELLSSCSPAAAETEPIETPPSTDRLLEIKSYDPQ